MQPYASVTGPYAYIAAGAALRDQGYGLINLTWPGAPSTSNLVAAYMVWSMLDDSVPADNGTLNGVNVTGSWVAYATPSPCWSPTYIYTFVAEVTSDVVNGVNNLTGFPSGITNGYSPWNQSQVDPMDEGAALVAIYDNGTGYNHQITLYAGALTTEGTQLNAQLNYSKTNSTKATTTYMIADGQLSGNVAIWNGTDIDLNAFPGSDPKESPYAWGQGNLSDTKTFAVNVTLGSNNTTAGTVPTGSDCFTWVGQVLSVGVPALKGPYNVTFDEQGLFDGSHWKITTNGTTHSGTVVGNASSIVFSLGNGSFSYSVKPVTGFTAVASGTYTVAGGPVFLRVIFHQLLYPVVFNETGLSANLDWWVVVSNSSQALNANESTVSPLGLTFDEANGSYSFSTWAAGLYTPKPVTGTFTVAGVNQTIVITYIPPPLYNVTFREFGLTPGLIWGAGAYTDWGSFSNRTVNDSFTLQLPNASMYQDYAYPSTVPGYYVTPQFYFGVYGAPETIDVNYSTLYPVYFNETGLSPNTYWYVQLYGTPTMEGVSTNSTIDLSAPNGTFTFEVTPVWPYMISPASGSITVSGSFATQQIVFTRDPSYTLTVNETGLAPGTNWSIELFLPNDSALIQTSVSTSMQFFEPNGSFEFFVGTVTGYLQAPTYGYVTIDGANAWYNVTYSPEYAVTFLESGLPSGQAWYAEFGGSYQTSYTDSNVFYSENGSFSFYIDSIGTELGTYIPTPQTGTVNVTGLAQTIDIVFNSTQAPTYTLTFVESGLPASDQNWSVTLNHYEYEYTVSTNATSLAFTEPNGSYNFSVTGPEGYSASPASGPVVISGPPATIRIDFTLSTATTYTVIFTESGLPSGATWYVNVTGQTSLSATVAGGAGMSVSLVLPNGNYEFTAASDVKAWSTSAGGPFSVVNSGLSIPVGFSKAVHVEDYSATFTESGLPNGAVWYINITGESGLTITVAPSSGTQLAIQLPNGSYTYSAADGWKNWTTTGGTFSVSGSSVAIPVAFTQVVTTPGGGNGGNGGNSPSSSSPALPWTWIGVAVAGLAAAFLILFALGRRRKKEKQPPAATTAPASGSPAPAGPPPPKSA